MLVAIIIVVVIAVISFFTVLSLMKEGSCGDTPKAPSSRKVQSGPADAPPAPSSKHQDWVNWAIGASVIVALVVAGFLILPHFYGQKKVLGGDSPEVSTEKLSPAQALVAKGYLAVRVVELDKKVKEGEAEIVSLRSQLSQRISRISSLESQLAKSGAENEKLRSQLAQAQTAQRQAEKARRTAEQAQRNVERKLSSCKSRKDDWEYDARACWDRCGR